MEKLWSLNELYTSFDSEDYQNDLKKITSLIKDINNWIETKLNTYGDSGEKIEDFLNYMISYSTVYSRAMEYSYLSLSIEAKNEKATKQIDVLNSKETEIISAIVSFQKWLAEIDIEKLKGKSDLINNHRFILEELKEKEKHLVSKEEEVIISRMKNTGSTAWSKLHQVITATLMVDININGEDKKLPLSIVRNMAYDKDSELRKNAYQAELESYKKIDESAAAALNSIKGDVITISNIKRYSSPLEKTLLDARMDQETLDVMLEAMEESLPLFHKYFHTKAKMLGHNNGLPFYDLFAPVGKVNIKFSYKEAHEFIVDNFKSFSDKLARFADKAFLNNWIDAEPREGKSGGAFCANIHSIGESRILANFTGSYGDVSTIAHELGHGYHGECLMDDSILNSNYPMPLAETASIFCQTIIDNAALKIADQDTSLAILENSLSDAGQVIVDIYSRYLFESEVFSRRKNGSLSVNELKEIMIKAQKKAYGNGLDHNYLHPYMWVCKTHYYDADYNYYNYPYAFGLLFGKGLFTEYLSRGKDFIEDYDRLLKETGKNKIVDVASLMNINIRNKSFWKKSLDLIGKEINKFIELSQG